MKTTYKYILSLAVTGVALPCLAGVGIFFRPPTVVISPPPPPVVVVAPAPVAVYPDDYVWDGTEYVGIIGGQYYYLGPGNVWIVCDPVRFHRFQVYMTAHPDWRGQMIHNMKYRDIDRGHEHPQPMHDPHGNQAAHDERMDHDHNGPPH
jgi:hypothetical protein